MGLGWWVRVVGEDRTRKPSTCSQGHVGVEGGGRLGETSAMSGLLQDEGRGTEWESLAAINPMCV